MKKKTLTGSCLPVYVGFAYLILRLCTTYAQTGFTRKSLETDSRRYLAKTGPKANSFRARHCSHSAGKPQTSLSSTHLLVRETALES